MKHASRPSRRRRRLLALVICMSLGATMVQLARMDGAQVGNITYAKAEVIGLQKQDPAQDGTDLLLTVRLKSGPDRDKVVDIQHPQNVTDTGSNRITKGTQLVVSKEAGGTYSYGDRFRLSGAAWLVVALLAVVVLVGRWRGLTGIVGLSVSIGILAVFVIPRLAAGQPAFATCLQGALLIAAASIFVAHGFSKRTSIAFLSTLLTLALVAILAQLATYLTAVGGLVTEDTAGLVYAQHPISLHGLLLGGIIIASLGVLDDITTGQAAAVDEIYHANPKQPIRKLYQAGLSVGREHIAALINTLALAYAGVALPAIVSTAIYGQAPAFAILNSEAVMEEIVRTIVASIGLIVAVPLTSWLAAWLLPMWYGSLPKRVTL